jgi:hypothetical protein
VSRWVNLETSNECAASVVQYEGCEKLGGDGDCGAAVLRSEPAEPRVSIAQLREAKIRAWSSLLVAVRRQSGRPVWAASVVRSLDGRELLSFVAQMWFRPSFVALVEVSLEFRLLVAGLMRSGSGFVLRLVLRGGWGGGVEVDGSLVVIGRG